MSDPKDKIEAILLRSYRLKISIKDICARAGVAPSTWSRWRANAVEPTDEKIEKLSVALDQLEAERA